MSDLDLRFRLTLTLKIVQHVCTWVMSDLDLWFRLTLTLKNNAACVYIGDERF